MTESNITKEHEGKHGVLTLGGIHRNEGTISKVGTLYFAFQFDKISRGAYFHIADGWQFTPDPDPLPTEPGWYVQTSVNRRSVAVPGLYFLGADRDWYQNLGQSTYSMLGSTMTHIHERDPLVRVSFGVAS